MLRGDKLATPTVQTKTQNKKISSFESLVNERFRELSAQKNKDAKTSQTIGELKKLIALFDQQQWGDGQEFKQMSADITKEMGPAVPSQAISKALKTALSTNLLQRKKGRDLVSYTGVKQVLALICLFDLFETKENFRQRLTQVNQTTTKQAVWALNLLYHHYMGDLDKSQALAQMPPSKKPNRFLDTLIYDKSGLIRELITVKRDVRDQLNLCVALTPLPKFTGQDNLQKSLSIFGFTHVPKVDFLKKRYKKLAMERHPDKYKSYQLSKDLDQTIHENFATIQQAYDILMEKQK